MFIFLPFNIQIIVLFVFFVFDVLYIVYSIIKNCIAITKKKKKNYFIILNFFFFFFFIFFIFYFFFNIKNFILHNYKFKEVIHKKIKKRNINNISKTKNNKIKT